MLKYIKDNLTTIDGVSIYPIISLLIFFIFFSAVIWWAYKKDKKEIEELKQLPLMED